MLPDDVTALVESRLETRITGARSLDGGCIAHASRVDTSSGPVFVKWASDDAAATFSAEAAGLWALREAESNLIVPRPLLLCDAGPDTAGVLVLEWVEPGARRDGLLPARPTPSILHGDLWGGNFLVAEDGRAALIDPAVYYGHREADLAMTELFGGFDGRFYAAYKSKWPLESGYEDRRDVYNLYHLINHLNHFGAGYADSVARILKRF